MKAIPAIDLIDGKVVRLYQGKFENQTDYVLNPVDYAVQIERNGIDRLHLVDLSGAKAGKLVHTDILRQMTAVTGLKIDFGGGVKTENDVLKILDAGGDQVVIGSLCVRSPELVIEWILRYGRERFVLALDTDGENVQISGWQEDSGKSLKEVLKPFTEFSGLSILTTDIRRDGTGSGPGLALYQQLVTDYPQFNWIASGGVESLKDLYELRLIGCSGCVVGKALLEGKITLEQLNQFNHESGI